MNAASWLESLPAGERTRTLLLREGPRIATWVLAIALGVQAALILTDLAGAGRGATAGSVVGPAPSRAHSLDLAAITNAHLRSWGPHPRERTPSTWPPSPMRTSSARRPRRGRTRRTRPRRACPSC